MARKKVYDGHPYLKWPAIVGGLLLWPPRAMLHTYRYTKSYGKIIQDKSILRQVMDQLRLAVFHSVSPKNYYTYRLYEKPHGSVASAYLFDQEIKPLQHLLNEEHSGILGNKLRFAQQLGERGIPVPSTIAYSDGDDLRICQDFRTRRADLFVKPTGGFGGEGALLFSYERDRYRFHGSVMRKEESPPGFEGAALTADELLKLLRGLSRKYPIIVQERLRNHPRLSDLSRGGLISVRVLTGYAASEAVFVRAVLKIPVREAITNNYGIAAPIFEESATVGAAVQFGPDPQIYRDHPSTGATIEGRHLPHWAETVEQCLSAHRLFPEIAFIGWDVGITDRGPVLLEGNLGWGAEILQKPHGKPLLDDRFVRICRQRLAADQDAGCGYRGLRMLRSE